LIPEPTWRPTAHEYHGRRNVWSASRLKAFRQSPTLARAGVSSPELPSEALVVGSAIGAYVLDHVGEIHELPIDSRRAKSYADAVRTWGRERLVLTRKEAGKAAAAADSIIARRTEAAQLAHALLLDTEGYPEWARQWTEEIDGVELRLQSMLDRACMAFGRHAYVELKSTRDPSPEAFTRQAEELGYDLQAAFGQRAIRAALGDPDAEVDVYFVAVRNCAPFEVWTSQASERFLERGAEKVDDTLARLAHCVEDETGASWRHPWERPDLSLPIPQLGPPTWADR